MFTLATLSVVTTSSRQLWAFARDAAVPNAKMIAYVHPRMKVPVVSIGVTATVSISSCEVLQNRVSEPHCVERASRCMRRAYLLRREHRPLACSTLTKNR
jgi:hypothetical protein